MLIFSGKLGETIDIPQRQFSVTVIDIQGGTVRLEISAPSEATVYRESDLVASSVANAETIPDSLDGVSAELSHAAYQILLRNGPVDLWIDLELGLWKGFAATVKNWSQRTAQSLKSREPQTSLSSLSSGHDDQELRRR